MKTDMPATSDNVIEEELRHTAGSIHRTAITAALSAIAMAILFDKNRDNPATLG